MFFGKFLRYPALHAALRATYTDLHMYLNFVAINYMMRHALILITLVKKLYNFVSSNWYVFDETFFFC